MLCWLGSVYFRCSPNRLPGRRRSPKKCGDAGAYEGNLPEKRGRQVSFWLIFADFWQQPLHGGFGA
jgi:hypothetical protein